MRNITSDWRLKVLLVRHAQSEANINRILQGQTDGTLTEKGMAQAHLLAEHFSNKSLDMIISSDLHRAYKTAQIVAKKQSLEVVTTKSLREWNAGILDGLPAASLEEAITKSQLPLSEFTPDDGESFSQLRERAINFLTTLETHNQGQVIMVCTHGDLLRVLVGSILEKDLESSMIIEFDNTSYTTIVLNNNGKWIVESINQVP